MTWSVILWWLLRTLGPILLEMLLKWLLSRKIDGTLGWTDHLEMQRASRELAMSGITVGQFNAAKRLIERHEDKLPKIWERIDNAKSKR